MKTTYNTLNLKVATMSVILFALLSIQSFAGDLKKINTETSEDCCSIELNIIASDTEGEIQLEDWMINIDEWNVENNLYLKPENEDEIQIEPWMLNVTDSNWAASNKVSEPEIELENWMTDLSQW